MTARADTPIGYLTQEWRQLVQRDAHPSRLKVAVERILGERAAHPDDVRAKAEILALYLPSDDRVDAVAAIAASLVRDILSDAPAHQEDGIDQLWVRWLKFRAQGNAAQTDAECGIWCGQQHAAELAIEAMGPSIARATAMTLIALFWALTDEAPRTADRGDASSGWALFHILPCFRPHVSGKIAHAIDHILAHPDVGMEKTMDALAREEA